MRSSRVVDQIYSRIVDEIYSPVQGYRASDCQCYIYIYLIYSVRNNWNNSINDDTQDHFKKKHKNRFEEVSYGGSMWSWFVFPFSSRTGAHETKNEIIIPLQYHIYCASRFFSSANAVDVCTAFLHQYFTYVLLYFAIDNYLLIRSGITCHTFYTFSVLISLLRIGFRLLLIPSTAGSYLWIFLCSPFGLSVIVLNMLPYQ
jgi:hypothetical protein